MARWISAARGDRPCMRLRVLLCATLIGACGSDERNDKTTAAPETAATTSETRGDGSADTTIAEQSVLKLGDFPSGWKRLGRAGENELRLRRGGEGYRDRASGRRALR